MLKLFRVSGFKNFRDTLTIDFSDVHEFRIREQLFLL